MYVIQKGNPYILMFEIQCLSSIIHKSSFIDFYFSLFPLSSATSFYQKDILLTVHKE